MPLPLAHRIGVLFVAIGRVINRLRAGRLSRRPGNDVLGPRRATIGGCGELSLALTADADHEHHVDGVPAGRDRWLCQVEPREGLAARAVEWSVAALAGAIARELLRQEGSERNYDVGHAKRRARVR